jgi:hypothetical protein
MAGHRGEAHTALLAQQNCDVWLLTEVHHHLELPGGYRFAARSDDMARAGQRAFKQWAAIATRRDASALTATHPATAAARVGSATYASSILPWARSGGASPWSGANHADRMANTLAALEPFFAAQDGLVWGGDWNQALEGKETAGSIAGRAHVVTMLDRLTVNVPTTSLPHRINGLRSIDHIGLRVPVRGAVRIVAADGKRRLSDHDLYVVDL